MNIRILTIATAAIAVYSSNLLARDYISIVGSSTVYPFATVVAENFGKSTRFKTPKIESTGSGGGLKLFCAGVGIEHPDITNSSRRIKTSEIESCAANGVTDIIEAKVGYDGIALANSRTAPIFDLSTRDIFLALAKMVPDPAGGETLIPNPYKTWNEINAALPADRIEVLGPPPTSGTRDAFAELALEGGCKKFDFIKAMKKEDSNKYKAVCHGVREDGVYIEAGENDNLIVQKLQANPKALGVFGFSFLDQNSDVVQGSRVNGVAPEFDSIADGSYPVSRSLFYYVKKAHVGSIPGLAEYNREFMSEKAIGDEGYLTDKGLIPMPKSERTKYQTSVTGMKPLTGLD
ncbi:MAG: substrate-binding domain-containing protein [Xanthomonadales bacterium]|jgi:phosphate transport system substrate-binding protein|nr:substrate-binding domain-containing protein [Xanthomonadales bacterium]MDH4001806.1 substrate-binding domain-containing protein [Xanthomonadales bacterium]